MRDKIIGVAVNWALVFHRPCVLEAQSSTRHRYSSQIRAYLSSASEALLPWEYQLFQSVFLPVNPPYTSPKKLHGKMTIGMNTSEILICISAGKDNLWLGLLGFHSIPFGLDDYSNERAK